MRVLIILSFLLLSLSAWAARIEIENTQFAKAERWHQLKAYFYGDDGSKLDITDDVRFQATGHQQLNSGNFYFKLPTFNSGYNFNVNVSISYETNNISYSDNEVISVDATPDYIRISGSTYVMSGFSSNYRAYGYYAGRMIDLTRNGRWHAYQGRIYNWGTYYAPKVNQGQYISDIISFRFGWKSAQMRVMVR